MIRFAEKDDVKAIRELWDSVFYEEPDFNEYYFKNIFDYNNTLIMIEENELMSMLQMLPYEINNIGSVTYIYGAATNPKYRKQGLMSELIKKSFEIDCSREIMASILIPANKPLFEFYEGLGYETVFYADRTLYNKGGDTAEIKEAEYEDIKRLTDIYKGDVVRSEEYWKIQLDMYKALGGKIFIYNNAYAVVSDKVEEIMFINENDRNILLNSICEYLKCGSVEVTSMGSNIPVGMIRKHKCFNADKLYMNLVYN